MFIDTQRLMRLAVMVCVCVCVLFCRELSGDCGLDAKLLLEQLLLIRQSLDVLFV